ncbi:unnamed protein product [Aphanomyces euteiches]
MVKDFGVSRELADETMTAEVGTAAWIAPKVLTNRGHYDQSADIHSLGVVLSEVDTWEVPYSSNRDGKSTVQLMVLVAGGKLRPSFRSDCPRPFHELAMACLQLSPVKRPKASVVAHKLRKLLRDGM